MSETEPDARDGAVATPEERRLLAVYLRDHFAGAAAGVALATRLRDNNRGTPYEEPLAEIAAEIRRDRDALRSLMAGADVEPSTLKKVLGAVGERFARLKSNGRFVRYSPSSRVVEIEGLQAGVTLKRELWRALRVSAALGPRTAPPSLGELEQRASDQLERLEELHERASIEAFGPR